MSDDRAFNTKFVEFVKNYPCIYDYRRQDHNKRDIVERAWSDVAKEFKLTAFQCKEKWKNLRTALGRSVKKRPSVNGAKKVKDYYLKDVMQFLMPFMKSKPQGGYIPIETPSTFKDNSDSESEIETDNDSTDTKELLEKIITRVVELPQVTEAESSDTSNDGHSDKKRKFCKSALNEADKCFIEYVNSKKDAAIRKLPQNNSDLEFLRSLLPDLAKMNDYQKRQFKKRTLDTIDGILCDGPSGNNT